MRELQLQQRVASAAKPRSSARLRRTCCCCLTDLEQFHCRQVELTRAPSVVARDELAGRRRGAHGDGGRCQHRANAASLVGTEQGQGRKQGARGGRRPEKDRLRVVIGY
jgi:hypothetical protein